MTVPYRSFTDPAEVTRVIRDLKARTVILDVEPLIAFWDTDQRILGDGVAATLARLGADPGQIRHVVFATNSARRPAALKSYREHIQLHLEPGLGLIPLAELDVHDLVAFYQALAKRRRSRDRAALSAATIQRVNTTRRAALNAARRQGLIDRNPASEIALPRDRRPRAVVWTDDLIAEWRRTGTRPPVAVWTAAQTARFLASCREHRLYAAYHLIALRGLRRGETIGLRWCDLDLDRGVGHICRQRIRLREQILETPPKTETSRRLLVLDRTTVAVLRHHRAWQDAECAATGSEPSGYVFTNLRGQPLHPDYLHYAFKKLTKAADLPPIRLHDLRHTAASLALEAGADLKVASDQLGHSSIVLTADTYISVLPALALKAAESTAKLIAKAGRRAPGSKRPRRRAAPIRARIRPPRQTENPGSATTAPGPTANTLPTSATRLSSISARSRAERSSTRKEATAR